MVWIISKATVVVSSLVLISACTLIGTAGVDAPLPTDPTAPETNRTPGVITETSPVDVTAEALPEDIVPEPTAVHELVSLARKDLAHQLSVPIEQIELLEVRAVTWPDTSLGCAEPGKTYAQVPQEGVLIRLRVDGQMVFYHSGLDQEPFLCERTSQIVPHRTPATDEFVPPPDSEID